MCQKFKRINVFYVLQENPQIETIIETDENTLCYLSMYILKVGKKQKLKIENIKQKFCNRNYYTDINSLIQS